jgi:hypothetical protein
MKFDRRFTWIEAAFGLKLASSLANSSYHVPDEDHEMSPTILASPKVTVEFTRQFPTEWTLRISPVSELTNFLELRPTLSTGEFVKVIEDRQGLKIGCPEEVALRIGLITIETLEQNLSNIPEGEYKKYLRLLMV